MEQDKLKENHTNAHCHLIVLRQNSSKPVIEKNLKAIQSKERHFSYKEEKLTLLIGVLSNTMQDRGQ